MIKNVLQEIGGIGIYGVISLCMFFTVFSVSMAWSFFHKRAYCEKMSALPLDGEKGEIAHEN
jgi:hypothetical protein